MRKYEAPDFIEINVSTAEAFTANYNCNWVEGYNYESGQTPPCNTNYYSYKADQPTTPWECQVVGAAEVFW